MTKADACKSLGLIEAESQHKVAFDYSLPQPWVDYVNQITGIYPAHCFIWLYDLTKKSHFGQPFPLTKQGKKILEVLDKLGILYRCEKEQMAFMSRLARIDGGKMMAGTHLEANELADPWMEAA